jgi:1-acyl-sn-glycerol-3-phosphate acyltransferase
MMAALRSLLFNTFMFLSVIPWVTAFFIVLPLPYRYRFAVASSWARTQLAVLRLVCGLDYRVEWAAEPPTEPCVVYIKHESAWETMAQLALFGPQSWVLKRELMWLPFFGWGLYFLYPIAINRSAGRSAVMQVVVQGRRKLAQGQYVVIFPEGHRMPPGRTRRYGMSGAVLACQADVPVVPVAHNAGDFWRRREFTKRPGTITVRIGPAIHCEGNNPEALNRKAQAWIESQMREISPHRRFKDAPYQPSFARNGKAGK